MCFSWKYRGCAGLKCLGWSYEHSRRSGSGRLAGNVLEEENSLARVRTLRTNYPMEIQSGLRATFKDIKDSMSQAVAIS